MKQTNYNPDVLSCLANLSNDEVFTPPVIVNQMLDLLPAELWRNPDATFLDPACKSGIFLREIAKRLMAGLAEVIPDEQERANHIFTKQLYGISITEMTALLSRRSVYCSKRANGKYSICTEFGDEQGNIRYTRLSHTWERGRCRFCGASQEVYDRGGESESYAYQFIHTNNPEKIFNMRFDVIIGNPPYQLSDGSGGNGTSATSIYQKFIQKAICMNPRFLTMIVPSRWFSGGKGLDEFRNEMLRDNHICEIHDFLEASDCFPGVQIKGGVNYFLWSKEHNGYCKVYMHRSNKITSYMERPLLENGGEYFIRYNEAIAILRKVQAKNESLLINQVTSRNPFGINSNFSDYKEEKEKEDNIRLYRYGHDGFISSKYILKNKDFINKYKVLVSKAGSGSDTFPHQILGKPFVAPPNSVCTETYIILGVYDSKEPAENLVTYVCTRFFRFMVSLIKNTQNAARRVYAFVPLQDFSEPWTDEKLYKKYNLTTEEIAFIESMIRPME